MQYSTEFRRVPKTILVELGRNTDTAKKLISAEVKLLCCCVVLRYFLVHVYPVRDRVTASGFIFRQDEHEHDDVFNMDVDIKRKGGHGCGHGHVQWHTCAEKLQIEKV